MTGHRPGAARPRGPAAEPRRARLPRGPIVALLAMASLLAAFAWLLMASQNRSERELEQRFTDRGALAARFLNAYVADLAALERRQATLNLQGAADRTTFERIVANARFQAAVLLDARGRVLQVWPRKPALLGQPIASRYKHLQTAVVEGRVGVSDVVPSAANGIPVVAIAAPYDTPQGRRVFSGAFDLQGTPLGAYLDNYTPIPGSAAYVVGAGGKPITSSDPTAIRRPSAAQRALFQGVVGRSGGGRHLGRDYVVVEDIAGTPWRVLLTVPTADLYRPVTGPRKLVGWLLLALFAAATVAVVVLLRRLDHKNAVLAETDAIRERLLDHERLQADRLRELDRMKDEFVAIASHELRTPLTSIGGYVELLLDDADRLEPDQLSRLYTIERNSQRVLHLVNDLLDLSRIENSELNLDFHPLSLAHIVREAIDEHAPAAAAKDVALDSSVTADAPMIGDATRLRQVIDNLLNNAIKYTPESGRVTVELSDATDRHGDDEVVFTIRDTGIGIPEAERPRLFERFYRASTARERHIRGTGLGLAITKAIVEAHGGSIAVTGSTPGTTFIVSLPSRAT